MHENPNFSLNINEYHFHKAGFLFKGLTTKLLTLENIDRASQTISKLMVARHPLYYFDNCHKNFFICADRGLKNEVTNKTEKCLVAFSCR